MACPKCGKDLKAEGNQLVCPSCGYVETMPDITDQKLEQIVSLLQQTNKSYIQAIRLMEFLIGEQRKK